ncbi:DjlA DnaJ-domain-containing proteins 1 [Comamonadaceae bacterium]
MNLNDDDFALFGLTQAFAQDRAAIDARWKELQREAHPDKFASHGVAAQRIAMQWSVRINEAYQRLKEPLRRAAYLCELTGFPIQAHSNTAMPTSFLMQQMEWRETLDDASEAGAVEALLADVQAARKDLLAQCEKCLDRDRDPASAVASVRALMFIDKFAQDLNQRLDQFE